MDFRILGPLDVRDGDRQLPLGGSRQRALLGLLLLHANEVVSSDRLVEELWGEADGSKALQVAVSRLRKVIGADTLVTRPPGYELRLEPGELDLHRFEELVAAARTADDPATASETLTEALALWRGPPLADLSFEPSLQTELARLEELRLAALEDRIEADLALGRHANAIGELEALTASHPLRERPRGQLMLALYRSGRQAESLEVYRDTRRVLVDELGIEPGRALKDLERAILAQDAGLEPEEPEQERAISTPLVGRERELAELLPVIEGALSGSGAVILLGGEPGIGKSSLAEALAAHARNRRGRVLVGRSWEAGGAPAYWPWVQALRSWLRESEPETVKSWVGRGGPELATILPELQELFPDLPKPSASDSGGSRFRLFDSIASLLTSAASTQPLAIFLDDLHAADAPSVLLLRYVAEELGRASVLVVGCYRDTEVGPELGTVLPDLARAATVRRVSLKGLSRSDTSRLLELTTGQVPPQELAGRVHAETDGNPLFAGEVARLLASAGRFDEAGKLPVPEGVREAIDRRLQGMSGSCRQVLSLASVLGREFELDPLERVSGLEQDDLFAALEEAMAARVVGEVPDGGARLRFSHMLIRDAVYEGLPATRRLRLHREVGEALESLYGKHPDAHLAELAHHYLLTGAAGAEKAVRYATAAGDRAASQLAYEEAARHYRSALQVLETVGPGDERTTCELLLSLGDVLHRSGNASEAKDALRRAADIAERESWADQLARAALGFSGRFAWARASTDAALVPLLERALAAVGEGDSYARVRLLARLAAAKRDDPVREHRVGIAKEGVDIAERSGDPATLVYALEGYWVAVEGPDTADELLSVGERLIPLAGEIGDKEIVFAARDHRLNTLWSLADRAAIDVELDTLGALAADMRQPAQQWSVGTDLTMLALMEGRFDDAERLIAETLDRGQEAENWNALVSQRIALFVLRRAQGRLGELEETISRSVHEYPALLRFRCALAHLYAELGRERETLAALDHLLSVDLGREYLDAEWLFSMSLLPDPCALVGDEAGAGELYSLLLPYESRYAEAPVEGVFGSVARGLGVLATALGEFDKAERHFATALEIEERMRARPWLAHVQHDLAAMRLARGDGDEASELLADAAATYRELGMDTWAARAEALRS
jgi:DNA-binding SARP family transcriptional activator/tetratricopeptide (TPR) repeat protein